MCGIFASLSDENEEELIPYIKKIQHRGPDASSIKQIDTISFDEKIYNLIFGFHRLAIVDVSSKSMQPIVLNDLVLICNGEIFNHKELELTYNLTMTTGSDCEVILHLYDMFGRGKVALESLLKVIRAEFAFVIYDMTNKSLLVARDVFGIRPLFISCENNSIVVASELKALSYRKNVKPFMAGSFLIKTPKNTLFHKYHLLVPSINKINNSHFIESSIKILLQDAVNIRLMSDRPVGCFLSGGVDSSIITALVAEKIPHLECFSIGLDGGVDIEAAKKVVNHINASGKSIKHHIINFTIEEGINVLKEVIWHLETYDITTIRASVPQFLLSQYIANNTSIKVLYSGEGADEVFNSYLYSRLTKSGDLLEKDSIRLLNELYMFDNLRVDRTTAAYGLEVRIPFLDIQLVEFMMSIDTSFRTCHDKIEKKILRDAFADTNLLPNDILYRQKHAFSDAVSSSEQSWYKSLVSHIDNIISDEELAIFNKNNTNSCLMNTAKSLTKEAYYYKKIFDELFPNRENVLTHYWMPKWTDTNGDPSATVLSCF
jgi:asparagine synthase (glutamine-hydrolysing)